MATQETIVSLIDAAKQLRAIAEELGDVEIKARVLDVLVELQEAREPVMPVMPGGHPPEDAPTFVAAPEESPAEIPPAARTSLLAEGFDREPARMEASGDIETYALAPNEPDPKTSGEESAAEPPATEDPKKPVEKGKPAKTKGAKNTNGDSLVQESDGESVSELSEEERFALAEQRIADLEPLHQSALKKMNDVLTPEQAARKVAATKQGLAAGLKGKPLQDAVFVALELTEEQQQIIAEGKHELHQVRLAIGNQVKGLLSKEQLDKLLRSHRH